MVDIVAEQKFGILASWLKRWRPNRRKGGFGKSGSLGVIGNKSSRAAFLSALSKKQLDAVADFFCLEELRRPPFGRHEKTGKGTRDKGEVRE